MQATRVLIVDDDPLIRALMERTLSQAGFAVDTADDGQVAIESVLARHYDVVLTDYRMPRLGGLEVGQMIRRIRGEGVAIIGMTASEECREQFFRAGADAFFEKPLERQALVELVETVRSLRRSPEGGYVPVAPSRQP